MRLTTAGMNNELITQLQLLNSQQATLQNQVSTGQRIFQPGDDPLAVSQVASDQMEQSALTQAGLNANTALTASQNTSAGLSQFKSLSDQAGQIAVLGSGTSSSTSMQSYALQANALLEQALTAGNTKVGGNCIFAGTAVTTTPFTVTRNASGQITAVTYAGSATSASIPLGNGAGVTPATDGATNAKLADFMNQLVALRNSLTAGDATATQAASAPLADSDDTIVNAISEQANVQSRIQFAQAQQQTQLTNLGQAISNAASVDLPATVVKLTQTTQAYQAALAAAAKFMNISLLNYIQ